MRALFTGICLTALLFSCKRDFQQVENLNGGKISVFGHAGLGNKSFYPINSLESLLGCMYAGADGTEIDVQMTKDSVLICFKDPALSPHTNCEGAISDLFYSDIQNCSNIFHPYNRYPLTTLKDFLKAVPSKSNYIYTLDCKLFAKESHVDFLGKFARAIDTLAKEMSLTNNFHIEARNPDFLLLLKKINPAYKLFIYPDDFESGLALALQHGFYGITIHAHDISKEQIKKAHDNGIRIALWNLETKKQNLEAMRKNPDFIQTDMVDFALKQLR